MNVMPLDLVYRTLSSKSIIKNNIGFYFREISLIFEKKKNIAEFTIYHFLSGNTIFYIWWYQ